MNTTLGIAALAAVLLRSTEIIGPAVANELFAGIDPDARSRNCSERTKKWVRVAKYAWLGAIAVAEGVCCLGTSAQTGGASCIACLGLGTVAAAAGQDIAEDYCG
jgi:hypothetical protein